MEIGYFFGNALSVVDAKGRTSLPASYRAVVDARVRKAAPGAAESSQVMLGEHPKHPCLQGYDPTYQAVLYARLQEQVEKAASEGGSFMDDLDDALVEGFGIYETISYDPAGRMVIPANLRRIAGLEEAGSVCLFIAAAETFQIWNLDRFRAAYADRPRVLRAIDGLKDPRR